MKNDKNYLDKKPKKAENLGWSEDEKGIVTLEKENTGAMNRIFQKLLKKPKTSYIHLDELGSYIWALIDGEKKISDFGEPVKEKFGDKAEPLYERLARYFQILDSYGFVEWEED